MGVYHTERRHLISGSVLHLIFAGSLAQEAAEHAEQTLGALLVLREASLWSLSQEDKGSNGEANSAQFR